MLLADSSRIYLIRLGLITYYNYRTSKSQARLDDLQKQRDVTIEQLKSATKYNTTQELLKKYGGAPTPKSKPLGASERRSTSNQETLENPRGGKTGIPPPPTANISGKNGHASFSNTLQQSTAKSPNSLGQPHPSFATTVAAPLQSSSSPIHENAEFAPNAFPSTVQYIQPSEGPKWYDRLMDVLLGEDESLPRNRIALICNQCRLVNGQAPPGVKGLENLGRWRCGGCGTMNGEEVEVKKIVANIEEETNSQERSNPDEVRLAIEDGTENLNALEPSENEQSDVTQYSEASSNEDGANYANAEKTKTPPSEESPLPKRRVGRPRKNKDQGN